MIKEIFKFLGFAGKKASKSIGNIVKKAGTAYQTGKNKLDQLSDSEDFSNLKEKAKSIAGKIEEKADQLIEKGKETVEGNTTIKSTLDKIKEEGKEALDKLEETKDDLSKKLEDSIFGEEE